MPRSQEPRPTECSVQSFARAMLDGECWTTDVATLTGINTEATFRSIEGCEREDSSSGNAAASTDGSTAESVRSSALCPSPPCTVVLQSWAAWPVLPGLADTSTVHSKTKVCAC